jgi:hypothetical protein
MLAPLVLALSALATLSSGSVSGAGHVASPEGVDFDLPRGMTYSSAPSEEGASHVASGPAGQKVVVSIRLLATDWAPPPSQSAGRTFRTARGLRGYFAVTALAAEASGTAGRGPDTACLVLLGRARVLVTIAATGRGPEAEQLARGVAESVVLSDDALSGRGRPGTKARPGERLRVDEQFSGCYTRVADTGSGVTRDRLCLGADGRYARTSLFLLSVFGKVRESREASAGSWGVKGGNLFLIEERDGSAAGLSTAPITATAGGMDLDGLNWDREEAARP